MFLQIKHELVQRVRACISDLFPESVHDFRLTVQYPARLEHGDFTFPFPFEMAKTLRQSPGKTAEMFLQTFRPPPWVKSVTCAGGGHINIHLDRRSLLSSVFGLLGSPRWWISETDAPLGKVIVEHTNINPNKAAHVGHLRNAILGDTLVRLMRFNQHTVEVQNYIDNTGVQVADVVVGFLFLEKMGPSDVLAIQHQFDYYCWDLYARVGQDYEAHPNHKERRHNVLRSIETGEGDAARMAELVAERIVNCHLNTMRRLDITYDVLPRESEILHLHFWNSAFEQLKNVGAVEYETDGPNAGCWVMKYQKDGQDDVKIIVRSNGTVTYTGKDIAYQLWKVGHLGNDFFYIPFRRDADGHVTWISTAHPPTVTSETAPSFGGGQRVYNVIDARQSYTQNVVFEGLRRLGLTREAENSIHFAYEMVALSPRCAEELGFVLSEEEKSQHHVEVSGRKGLGVKADDLIDRLEQQALLEVSKRNPDLSEPDCQRTAHQIAVGALRYFLLKFTRNSLIVFDMADAMNFEGETGPYLQYSAVRACNIIKKFRENYHVDEDALFERISKGVPPDVDPIEDDVWELVQSLLKVQDIAESSLQSCEISTFTRYLYTLSQKFSNFYNRYRIMGEADPGKQQFRLSLVVMYSQIMRDGLSVLGIDVPERM